MKPTRVVLMTGNGLRHRYAAGVVGACLRLAGVVSEQKASPTAHLERKTATGGAADHKERQTANSIIKEHFARRDTAERKLLGANPSFPDRIPILNVAHNASNSDEVFGWIKERRPDAVLLYGTSIIRAPLLDHYEGRVINLHLGLSPYYRGSGTNFWPLVDGLPECVGATIHLATLKVDAGDILAQARPEDIDPADNDQQAGTRTIMAGVQKMCAVLPAYLAGQIKPASQDLSLGKLCRRGDFTPAAVLRLRDNLKQGMIARYLAEKEARDRRYPIYDFYE